MKFDGHRASAVAAAKERGAFQHVEELDLFVEFLLRQIGLPARVLEIGTLYGGTTELWLRLTTETVVSIDLPDGDFGGRDNGLTASACLARNVVFQSEYGDKFIGLLADSTKPSTFNDVINHVLKPFDLLFIDGDHKLTSVQSDFSMYSQLVRPGGIVAFHDINDTPYHAQHGVDVPKFWQSLTGEKHEFTVNREWGGIGALVV